MKKVILKKFFYIFFLIFILKSVIILSAEFRKQSNNISDFVPKNWKIIELEEGDLNEDGLTDAVIVIEDTNYFNFKEVEHFGEKYTLEPRAILILFKNKNNNYTLVSKNNNGFIAADYSLYDHTLPYEGSKINKNNTLSIYFSAYENGLGVGNWNSQDVTYIFRWQNNCFELIGYEYNCTRKIGDIFSENISVNFSTNKAKATFTYFNENKADKIEWKNIKIPKKFILDDFDLKTESEIFNLLD